MLRSFPQGGLPRSLGEHHIQEAWSLMSQGPKPYLDCCIVSWGEREFHNCNAEFLAVCMSVYASVCVICLSLSVFWSVRLLSYRLVRSQMRDVPPI